MEKLLHGLVQYNASGMPKENVPLQRIDIKVTVVGFVASVESDLYYINNSTEAVQTEFVFPLDADSAVYKFEAEINNRVIIAEVQEKSQAKETYQNAIENEYVGLYMAMDDDYADVFRLKLGNLPGKKSAKLTFAYAREVDMETDDIGILTLPTVLNPRYVPDTGSSPFPQSDGATGGELKIFSSLFDKGMLYMEDFFINFEVKVAGGGNGCLSSEKITMDVNADRMLTSLKTVSRRPELGTDFVLELHYKGFDKPCAILEKGKDDNESGFLSSDVLMVNFSPLFSNLQTNALHEFVFLIDRSGSMGSRIGKAKETLLLLLKSLPVNCSFNVVSFGSEYSLLFPKSEPYSEESMEKAMGLQREMGADMGGTEIYRALLKVFEDKPVKVTRQVFLLTDGEVGNVQEIVKLVRSQTNTRVFTFGIGNGCSTELIRDVAKAGKGKATFVRDSERLQNKVMSVMKCSLCPTIKDLSLTWSLPDGCSILNVPKEVPTIFQGDRLILYGMISGEISKETNVKSSLKMIGKSGELPVEYGLEFDLDSTVGKNDEVFLLHRLAAKARISELEMEESGDTKMLTALSTAANITCRETAFVGFDKNNRDVLAQAGHQLEPAFDGYIQHSLCLRSYGLMDMGDNCKRSYGFTGFRFHFENPFKKVTDVFSGIFSKKKGKAKNKKKNSKESVPSLKKKDSVREDEKTTVMMELIELQKFDGSWELTRSFADLLRKEF
ncbi:von Willebrand factor A domain-containing protein 5A-like [Saccostrea echinata]|uniref:von Willebrand factor A domain-containing protein 5A-like n=1 Tax=Saccostrea echinata TaxID=191078 RepID=UPI002A836F04|nr:von Willebrand factor A domain-containing protein 5A-like [Saccostrea echinata]